MSAQQGETFSRYIPQHPLPEEIKNLARDDTVCKYCGVSYLIHNEIKALEEKLSTAEKELFFLRGQVKREEVLQRENALLKQQKEDLQLSVETNTKLLFSQSHEIESLKEQNRKIEDSVTSYKKKHLSSLRHYSSLNQTVRQQRQSLQDIREKFSVNQLEISQIIQACLQSVKIITETAAKEKSEFESKIQCLEMEKMVLVESNKKMADNLKEKEKILLLTDSKVHAQREEINRLENFVQDADVASQSLKNLESTLNDIKKELEGSENERKILLVELDQYKIQMRNKTTELNNIINTKKQQEQSHELALQKLNLEMRAKEIELDSCMKNLKSMESLCQEYQRKENEMTQQSKLGHNEIQDLKDSLQRVKSDNKALKVEREMMIEAHQNRIEDLRESFKNKMAEADVWPQKLEAAVVAEKARHINEMKALEDGLKHNFVLELQIEKDKYNELFKKFHTEERGKNNIRETQQTLLEHKYKQEVEELNKQMADIKKRGQEMESELEKEIISLKKIVNDLQDRLARLDGDDTGKMTELKNELSKKRQEFLDVQNNTTLLEEKLKEALNENQFLQNIVRKECEERCELTEALSHARKELLELKKPLGGYSSVQKRGSISSNNSEKLSIPSPPQAQPADLVLKLRSPHPTNSVNLSYSGQSSRKNSSSSIGSDKSIEAEILKSRKRIASMMGRLS